MAINAVGAAGRICVLDLDLQGVRSLKKSEISPYYIFIQPASFEDLEMRLRERYAPGMWHTLSVACIHEPLMWACRVSDSEETIMRRLQKAKEELEYGSIESNFDHILVNDKIDEAFLHLSRQLKMM
jgi:guanylate kinase